MENDKLDELCKKITGKSYDQMLNEISKHPYKVMSFSIDSTPEGFVITTELSSIALKNPIYGKQIQESFEKLASCIKEEAVKIANVNGSFSGFKVLTNMKDMKEKP